MPRPSLTPNRFGMLNREQKGGATHIDCLGVGGGGRRGRAGFEMPREGAEIRGKFKME